MQRALRLLALAALAWQGASAVRMTIYDWHFHSAKVAYRADRYDEALKGFVQARAIRAVDPDVWAWIGDAADAAGRNPPSGGWSRAQSDDLMTAAWAGYTGAVLRSPLDTASWRGVAEIALRRASSRDAERGVDLAELDRRSQGLLDPWRGAAMVAAKIAIELKPSGFQELDELTRVYTSAGQLDAAQESLIRSARMMPAPSFHTWGSGERLVKPLYDATMAAMREGLRRAPGFEQSALHLDIARFAFAQGDLEIALDEMGAALMTAPDLDSRYLALRGRAEVLDALGRFDQEVLVWDAVIDTGVAAVVDRRARGMALHRARRDKDACRDLRETVRDEPKDRNLRVIASSVCDEGGDAETAERLLRDGFALPIDDLGLARNLLDLYLLHGKRGTVDGLLRTWMRDYPEQVEIRRWAEEISRATP